MNVIQSCYVQASLPQCGKVSGRGNCARSAGPQTTVNSRCLRPIFESMHSGQTPFAAQGICRVTVCITDAHDASIVPLHDFIQQAHQIGVGDERANFRFVDRHVSNLLKLRQSQNE